MTKASAVADARVKTHPSLGAPGDYVVYVPRILFAPASASTLENGTEANGEQHASCNRHAEAAPRIKVRVPGAEVPNIFAHRQWHAGMLLGDLLYGGQIEVGNKIVLELGAGTGIPGIVAHTCARAAFVLSTDYDSPPLVETLRANVAAACSDTGLAKSKIRVMGHTWNQCVDDVGEQIPAPFRTEYFDVILLADCVWDPLSHASLLQSVSKLLARKKEARVFLASGLHTGRETVVSFLRRAYKAGLIVVPIDKSPDDEKQSSPAWPRLSSEEEQVQKQLLSSLQSGADDATIPAVENVYELEINPITAEDDAGTPLQDGTGAHLYLADHVRLTGRRRAFVINERSEELRENSGVYLRNRWMTFTALGWRDLQSH